MRALNVDLAAWAGPFVQVRTSALILRGSKQVGYPKVSSPSAAHDAYPPEDSKYL